MNDKQKVHKLKQTLKLIEQKELLEIKIIQKLGQMKAEINKEMKRLT